MNWKVIKTDEDYERALARIEELFGAEENTLEGDELDLLIVLVKNYEEEYIQLPDVDPIKVIEFYLEQRGMDRSKLVGVIGDKTSVSKILKKRRKLNLNMIRNVSGFLDIPIELLTKDYNLTV